MKQKLLKKQSDEALLKGLATNDREVLYYLYNRYFPMIRGMVVQNSGGEESAKDLFQEGLMVLYDKAKNEEFVLTAGLSTYLYAVCKRLWLKQLNQRDKDPIFPNDNEEENLPDVTEGLENHEEKEKQFKKLGGALQALGSPCKDLLKDFYASRLSMQQLAEKYGYTNTDNAKTQKYKCLQRLKKIYFQQAVD